VIILNPKKAGHEREMPHAHFYHIFLPILFITIWILDTSFLKISTIFDVFVPFLLRLILFGLILIIALSFIQVSHKTLFKSHQPPTSLIKKGILGRTRNPMYFGILLIYVACICLSISLVSIAVFFLIFIVYNNMVKFEEKILENLFGDQFLEYKKTVPRWFPKIRN
jgi:protein-S-isoprenylcysteine O-methyltransferase Ste14